MLKNIIIGLLLICMVVCPALSSYAKTVSLNHLLNQITHPRTTSLQRLDIISDYKGKDIRGSGKVNDILRSFGSENEAMIYLKKSHRGKNLELVLFVDLDTASKIKKGKKIKFEGVFVGMSADSLRFEGVEVTGQTFWPF